MANQPVSESTIPGGMPQEGPRGTAAAGSRIEAGAERFKQGTHETVQTAKEKFNAAADRVDQGVQQATDSSARAAKRATEKAAEMRERGRELAEDARERAADAFDAMRDFVRERPVQSLAIALGTGWLIGRLLGRR
ncbi:MAG TPA: hypothetical protein VJ722_04880 [Rhodanobacteraceae bacterium]|nr:hypothetical protein [Rhodanobacteraceae bacterium]